MEVQAALTKLAATSKTDQAEVAVAVC